MEGHPDFSDQTLKDIRIVQAPKKKTRLLVAINRHTKLPLDVVKALVERGGRLGVSLPPEKAGATVELVAADEPDEFDEASLDQRIQDFRDPRVEEPLFHRLRGQVKKTVFQTLGDAEPVKVVVRGGRGQAMIGTDSRVIVCKPGWMAGATLGSEVTSWQYRALVGVQTHKGIMGGAVVLQGPGQSGTKTSYWGNKDDDPFKAPNAIPIVGDWKEVRDAVTRLQQLVDAVHRGEQQPASISSSQSSSLADELAKLASLHQSGVLDADEFKAAKQRLLDQN